MIKTDKTPLQESRFRFLQPHLNVLCFSENENFDQHYAEYNGEKDSLFKVHSTMELEVSKIEEENSAYVSLKLRVNMDDKTAIVPYQLEIVVGSVFEWESDMADMVDNMLEVNAPALLLSYMRPIVSTVTGSSRFPRYDIPFINFRKQKKMFFGD